ncbi:hypothetical protein P171DRAFT_425894 [Karstenula rhodostoma CBS 690.94]|uniref:Uncharacterized protein n=1 Tax=Karstenula rhodostoma CBS 690.94 TaxID=1392251 RepID=A0A9P4UI71_9PLEO|nr:hypothetical protein P171DRAFT_425894 [Karstenula rhodostoma CBS 690.94]
MPTEEENIQYLYLVLTHAGPPQVRLCPAVSPTPILDSTHHTPRTPAAFPKRADTNQTHR